MVPSFPLPVDHAMYKSSAIYLSKIHSSDQIAESLNKEGKGWKQERGHRKNRLWNGTRNKGGIYQIIKNVFIFRVVYYIFQCASPCIFAIESHDNWQCSQRRYYFLHTAVTHTYITYYITYEKSDIYRVDPASGLQISELQNPTRFL